MVTDESKIWEKMFGQKVCTEKLNVEWFRKPIPFDIYDGYAICSEYNGHTYEMEYPQLRAIKDSDELSNAIIDYIGDITDKEEITVIHTLITFNTLYEDGVEVKIE